MYSWKIEKGVVNKIRYANLRYMQELGEYVKMRYIEWC